MIENGPPILLKNLGFSTSERLNSVGRCTFELGYTKDDDVTCLSFIINVVPGEIGGRFSQLTLNFRLLDLVESGAIQFETDSYNGANATSRSPEALMMAKPSSQNTTEEIYTWQSGQKRIIWTLVEKVGIKRGVAGKHIFRLRTRTSLPLHAEINVSARYLKDGNTKDFEIPGKDKFLEYTYVVNPHWFWV